MDKPSFDQWVSCSSKILCDAHVMCTDGNTQMIKGCTFGYNLDGSEAVFKGWYFVKDCFFVDKVLVVCNFREVS